MSYLTNPVAAILNDIETNGAIEQLRLAAEATRIYGTRQFGEVLCLMLEEEGSQKSREQSMMLRSAVLVSMIIPGLEKSL